MRTAVWLTEGGPVLAWLRISNLTLILVGGLVALALALR